MLDSKRYGEENVNFTLKDFRRLPSRERVHIPPSFIHSFIHSAPTGSIVGTHVRHTPVGSPGQHEVLFTVETPEFDAADPVDPLAFQNGVLTGQPQTILETSS